MPNFHVKWSVQERVVGPGEHDHGIREGDVFDVAKGETDKEAESEQAIYDELNALLRSTWPQQGLGPTYNLDRVYKIEITPVP